MFEKRCLYLRAGIQDAITRIATNPGIPSKASIQVAAILQAVLDEDEATPIIADKAFRIYVRGEDRGVHKGPDEAAAIYAMNRVMGYDFIYDFDDMEGRALFDAETNIRIRTATVEEAAESDAEVEAGCDEGIILVDGARCYVAPLG
jgi:hypothetical protein